MENKIKETTEKLLNGTLTKDEADKILLGLLGVISMFDKCDKCGGTMRHISRNSQQCDTCFNTWNNIQQITYNGSQLCLVADLYY